MDSPNIIRNLRFRRGKITLREAAKKLDCDFTYLSKVENGVMRPSWKFLQKAFVVYNIPRVDQCMFAYLHLQGAHPKEFEMGLEYIASKSPRGG